MVSKITAFCFSIISILPTPLFAREQILCQTTGQPNVIITLGSQTKYGRVLNCIAGDFVYDMTPCAPDGGFGISYPTGSAGLAGIVDRWQDYANHLGGIAGNFTNDHEIYFSGGFNSPITNTTINQNRASVGLPPIPNGDRVPEGQGYKAAWEFRANRLTGKGELKKDGKITIYKCARAKALF